jgi:2-keto-myo-inositol isomerase
MLHFALNHMTVPMMPAHELFQLSRRLGCTGVEFRNDLATPMFSGQSATDVGDAANKSNQRILAVAEVKAFNDFSEEKLAEALALMKIAQACGAEAISLIPRVGGEVPDRVTQQEMLRQALIGLQPGLLEHGLLGLIEPIGFDNSTLRHKEDAVEIINELETGHNFKLIHDTFHHHLAGGGDYFASHTGLVHISGVVDPDLRLEDMGDEHRVLVDGIDRLNNIEQLERLSADGYNGPISFEAFSPRVHDLTDPEAELTRSISFIDSEMSAIAA